MSSGATVAVNGTLAVVGASFLTVFAAERTALFLEPNETTKIVPYYFNVQPGKFVSVGCGLHTHSLLDKRARAYLCA